MHQAPFESSSRLNFDSTVFNVTSDTRVGEEFQRVAGHDRANDGAVGHSVRLRDLALDYRLFADHQRASLCFIAVDTSAHFAVEPQAVTESQITV